MATSSGDLSTVHLYYDDTEQFTCEAKVIAQEELEKKDGGKQLCLILDRTVMHPQGGKVASQCHEIVCTRCLIQAGSLQIQALSPVQMGV